jgi:hypothetical protein
MAMASSDTAFFSSIDGIEFDLGGLATVGMPFLESRTPRDGTRVNRGEHL